VTTEANQRLYDRPSSVRLYTAADHLEPPERTLIDMLEPELATMRMLDVGVGAGRTTVHFAPLVAEYVGVDYAPSLVAAARSRFALADPPLRFEVADARDLARFDDEAFDLVLFSVNGIDCLDHAGRLASLREMRRVCRPGGFLFFSSHNLPAIGRAFSFRRLLRELRDGRSALRYAAAVTKRMPAQVLQRVGNPSPRLLEDRERVLVSKRWPPRAPVSTYHVAPAEVRRQLGETGWELERVVLPSGDEIPYEESHRLRDPLWLNFLARAVPLGNA
jgi:SAM-dependent methyltransferase